jgi:quinol monooxygenase YgiN
MSQVKVFVTYRPKKGSEARFLSVLKRHWPALRKAELVSRKRPQVWRATDKRTRRTHFIETFEWKDASASDLAHQTPEVMAVWRPMEPLLESMDIAVVRPVSLPFVP